VGPLVIAGLYWLIAVVY